jgi:hypothetical protein
MRILATQEYLVICEIGICISSEQLSGKHELMVMNMNGMIVKRKTARKKARLHASEMEKLMSQVFRLQRRLTWRPVVKEMHSIVAKI